VSNGRFAGKVLLATGAGSGLAAATARRFSAEGGAVALVDRDLGAAQAVADELPRARALEADVADEASVRRCVEAADAEFGRIDAVFNAAGHADFGPIADWDWPRWSRMMEVHVGGTFLFCRETLPVLRRGGGGAIVNVASVAALSAQMYNAPYGAAKGAIAAYSRQLALEVAPDVRVNTIAPGRILTGMTRPLYTERGGGDLEKGAAQAGANNMFKRLGDPDEIAAPVCFLLSDDASFMTAALVVIDGGETGF
jgi:NAD(P)-dependent dehydrogenase (short-subunit alcohol dehydrogenase family)